MADFDINRLPAKPTERVIKAKEMFLEENPEMCCQRAIIYTEVYRNLSGRCPTILLRAKALCRTLEELPIFIQPQEVIVGHSASRPRSAEVFPEVNINFTDEIDQFETRGTGEPVGNCSVLEREYTARLFDEAENSGNSERLRLRTVV